MLSYVKEWRHLLKMKIFSTPTPRLTNNLHRYLILNALKRQICITNINFKSLFFSTKEVNFSRGPRISSSSLMSDIESVLRAQEANLDKDREIQRIIDTYHRDAFAVIGINPLVTTSDLAQAVKKLYRRKSLLIHPDKVTNPKAPEAFDALKKAHEVLSSDDESHVKERDALTEVYRKVLEGIGTVMVDDFNDKSNVKIRGKVAEALKYQEKQFEVDSKLAQQNDAKRQEEIKSAAMERQQKKKWEKQWEEDRDLRVKLWRNFSHKVEKKKKKKLKPLA